MHKKLLRKEKWRWYIKDVAFPVTLLSIIAILFHALYPFGVLKIYDMFGLGMLLTMLFGTAFFWGLKYKKGL